MLFLIALLASAVLASPVVKSQHRQRAAQSPSALYFLDNDPAGGSIVSMQIGDNGSISNPQRTSTEGYGLSSLFFTTGDDFPVDSTLSQGAVMVKDSYLFTINSGSNTLSLFLIDPLNPTNVQLRDVADTMGEFPVSVDYSPKLKKACVLNGGAVAGVACYDVDTSAHKMAADGPLRNISPNIINETTPAAGPPGSAGQIGFDPDSTAIYATVKGNSFDIPGYNGFPPPGKLGSLIAWPVENGKPRYRPVVTKVSDFFMDYAFQFLSESKMFIIDASSGSSFFDVGPHSDWVGTELVKTDISRNNFSCWTAWEPALNSIYAVDAQHNEIFILDDKSGEWVDSIHFTQPGVEYYPGGQDDYGLVDVIPYKGLMYAAAVTNGIFTFDLKEKMVVDYYNLTDFGNRKWYQGMATFPACDMPYTDCFPAY